MKKKAILMFCLILSSFLFINYLFMGEMAQFINEKKRLDFESVKKNKDPNNPSSTKEIYRFIEQQFEHYRKTGITKEMIDHLENLPESIVRSQFLVRFIVKVIKNKKNVKMIKKIIIKNKF